MRTSSLLWTALLSTSALACGASPSHGATTLASGDPFVRVTVRLEEAMISPARADGRPWDVATPIDEPNARPIVLAAMDSSRDQKRAYDAAAAEIARFGDAWGRPDIAGKGSVEQAEGKADERVFEGTADTFTPKFGVSWSHVPLSHWTTMHMYFVEKDPGGTEDVGAVVLSAHDLAKALEQHGRVHHVRVDDQTNGQVLYVGIVVTPED